MIYEGRIVGSVDTAGAERAHIGLLMAGAKETA